MSQIFSGTISSLVGIVYFAGSMMSAVVFLIFKTSKNPWNYHEAVNDQENCKVHFGEFIIIFQLLLCGPLKNILISANFHAERIIFDFHH